MDVVDIFRMRGGRTWDAITRVEAIDLERGEVVVRIVASTPTRLVGNRIALGINFQPGVDIEELLTLKIGDILKIRPHHTPIRAGNEYEITREKA